MQLYVRSESVVSRVIAGETLIVPVRRGVGDLASIYSLNEVGSAIWEAVSQPRNRGDIVDFIARDFDGELHQIEGDVDVFLAEMRSAGLIQVSELAA
jgi:hypothetical protein